MPEIPQNQEQWLNCLSLPEYAAMIPSGQLRPIVGPVIWIDGTGAKLTTGQYMDKWGFDPKIAWDAIKEYRRRLKKEVKTFEI